MARKLLDIERLIRGCADDSADGGIHIRTHLVPLAGSGAPVKPAIYPGARTGDPPRFQEDLRWSGDPPERTTVIVLDSVPSQANRVEAALARLAGELGLPQITLDLSGVETLPGHLPKTVHSFQFPHRHADAYLRDAQLDGAPFHSSETGRGVLAATADQPAALFRWFPQSLLFGYWQSHLGSKRTQAKLARSWTSEIIGVAPATSGDSRTRLMGTKGDPVNLSTEEGVEFDKDDYLKGWRPVTSTKDKLAAIGYGQVPYSDGALAGVSFRSIEQMTTVSFAGLRRIAAKPEGRALLVALGLVGHVAAFGTAFSLRSGCDLTPVSARWSWIAAGDDDDLEPLVAEEAIALFRDAASAAGELSSGGGWGAAALNLTPTPALADAIRRTWPLPQ